MARLLAALLRTVEPLGQGHPANVDDIRVIRTFLRERAEREEWQRGIMIAAMASRLRDDRHDGSLHDDMVALTAPSADPQLQRQMVSAVVTLLLNEALLAPFVGWDETTNGACIGVRIGSYRRGDDQEEGNLLTILVPQLCTAMSSPLGIFDCDGCGRPYAPPNRRPKARPWKRYCPECSGGASLAAKRDSYHRRRAAGGTPDLAR